jgi:8-oxo-dGTP diphosphatase
MSGKFFKQCVAVYLILERDGNILFVKRRNTGFMDGYWGLPAGKVDENEELLKSVIREAKEELGVEITAADLSFCHLNHRHDHTQTDTKFWIDVYFRASRWYGEPANAEPHKAEQIAWLDPSDINLEAASVIPYIVSVLNNLQKGKAYSGHGWSG